MLRQRVAVTEPVPGRDVRAATARLVAARDRLRARRRGTGDLDIRVTDDGRVRLSQVSGKNTVYPLLSGRLESVRPGAVHLVGTAREHPLALVWVGVFVVTTAVCVVGLAASLAGGDGAGIAVCSVGGALLHAITWGLQRGRRSFRREVEEQLAALRRAVS